MKRQRGTGSIFLQPGSSIWWYQIWVNGKRERGSTGCRSKREADAFVRRKQAEYSVGLSSPETQKVTLKALVADVLLRNKNNGNKTVADDESRWKNHLEPFFGHLRATQVSSDLIDRYINKRKSDQTRSKTAPENGTINRELALLKSAFNHGTEQTPPKVRFVPHFNMLEENNVRRGFLQDEQYLRLSRECAVEGIWLAGLFETAYAYGWREDELLALRVGQLDLLGKIIDLGETKNGDQRMIHMTEHVFQCLVRCVAGKKSDDFVFTRDDGSRIKDFRQAWWNACIRAGLGRFECRDCGSNVSEGRKCTTCESKKKAKYVGDGQRLSSIQHCRYGSSQNRHDQNRRASTQDRRS
ncbi:MAG: tyrosine-type recombinase/integrase [Candidatus Sulfotelmatobacter sp.]